MLRLKVLEKASVEIMDANSTGQSDYGFGAKHRKSHYHAQSLAGSIDKLNANAGTLGLRNRVKGIVDSMDICRFRMTNLILYGLREPLPIVEIEKW
jgi:hypothetical protein